MGVLGRLTKVSQTRMEVGLFGWEWNQTPVPGFRGSVHELQYFDVPLQPAPVQPRVD